MVREGPGALASPAGVFFWFSLADPEGERRAIKLDALGGQHFGLAIEMR
jgi:hypothetical protein